MSLERAIYDLDVGQFVEHFLSPYDSEDSLEYMAEELVTLKSGEALKMGRETVQELLNKSQLRQGVEEFVKQVYDLKHHIEERKKILPHPESFGYLHFDRDKIENLIWEDYQILSSYSKAVEKLQEIESESLLLKKLNELGSSIGMDENYQTAQKMVEMMENFGESKLHIRYDYFETVKGVQHMRFDPHERGIREMLSWYLQTIGTMLYRVLDLGLAYMFPTRKEMFYARSLEFLIEQNVSSIQTVLEYRKMMDFFLGATRYVEKIKSAGIPLTFPSFTKEEGFSIKELYNPCLLLQRGIKRKKDIVPNDVESQPEHNVTIITGPNNTGKTVYVKSIGLAYALAQNGFPIPAVDAQLSELDGLYTHFIHPEDITLGEGSFLDEIKRIKECYKNATNKSLLIVDEPIRGTSPEDTIELTLRFIKGFIELGAPTFLTTHLHSVSKEVDSWERIRNLQTEIKISGTMIRPTYRIIPGRAEKSYGVRVADEFGLKEEDIIRMIEEKST